MKSMNMKRRIEKVKGLQQTFINLESGKEGDAPPLPSPEPPAVTPDPSPPEEVTLTNETRVYDGKVIESYHPKVYEVFQMTDTNPSPANGVRAVGVDIGTGFISCAEVEEGSIKF